MTCAVHAGSMLACTSAPAPGALMVLPVSRVLAGGTPMANIGDAKPFVNVMTFGMCSFILKFPVFVGPCVPGTAMWMGVSRTLVGGMPAAQMMFNSVCPAGPGAPMITMGVPNVLVS